jgi:hypothetical protein
MGAQSMKICSKCHDKKPLDDFTTRGGNIEPRCQGCRQEDRRDYYERTKDRFRERSLETTDAWRKANMDHVRETKRRYRARISRWWVNGI